MINASSDRAGKLTGVVIDEKSGGDGLRGELILDTLLMGAVSADPAILRGMCDGA